MYSFFFLFTLSTFHISFSPYLHLFFVKSSSFVTVFLSVCISLFCFSVIVPLSFYLALPTGYLSLPLYLCLNLIYIPLLFLPLPTFNLYFCLSISTCLYFLSLSLNVTLNLFHFSDPLFLSLSFYLSMSLYLYHSLLVIPALFCYSNKSYNLEIILTSSVNYNAGQ